MSHTSHRLIPWHGLLKRMPWLVDYILFDADLRDPILTLKKNCVRIGGAYPIERIMPIIGSRDKRDQTLDGIPVKVSSKKLHTFLKKGTTCVGCGIRGERFYREIVVNGNNARKPRANLALYAVGLRGREILMTRDHIRPFAKTRDDSIENSQPMCTVCNQAKGDREPISHQNLIRDLVLRSR